MRSILIIEDDENLSRGIAFLFEKDGFQTHVAPDLAAGRSILREQSFDLLILDLGLPDGDGIHFCAELREHSDIPIIILTARDMEIDEVSGLTAGADDYITKPFSLSVLRARVQACLRRSARLGDHCLYSGRFSLDLRRCRLFDEEKEIAVTASVTRGRFCPRNRYWMRYGMLMEILSMRIPCLSISIAFETRLKKTRATQPSSKPSMESDICGIRRAPYVDWQHLCGDCNLSAWGLSLLPIRTADF